jgi:hypothetical protein
VRRRRLCRAPSVTAVAVLLALAAPPASPAAAQAAPTGGGASRRPRLELRADAIAGRATHAQLGVGATGPLGNYVRVDAVAAAGTATRAGDTRFGARGDLLVRFLLDPFRQSRWGPYGGGGVSALHADGVGWSGYVVALVGLEGPPRGGFLPALELGLGGGTRVGVVLRRVRGEGR